MEIAVKMTHDDRFVDEEHTALFREAVQKDRGYAGYWKTPFGKGLEEWHVARALLDYLEGHAGLSVTSLTTCDHDPPDCVAKLADGRRIGIEVTELVHRRTVERHMRRQHGEGKGKSGDPKAADPYETAQWTSSTLRDMLEKIVSGKDKQPRTEQLDGQFVAIFTDETMVTPELLDMATAGLSIGAKHLDGAYLLFSYHPDAKAEFADGIQVVKLPVSRSSGRRTDSHEETESSPR